MDILSITTIKILLLFFPGIIYCLVHEKITFHPKREFNYFLIRSFVFGVLSYFVYGMYITIFQGKTLEDVVFLKYITSATKIDELQVYEIFYASICATTWAIIYAWLKNQHVFENIFNCFTLFKSIPRKRFFANNNSQSTDSMLVRCRR